MATDDNNSNYPSGGEIPGYDVGVEDGLDAAGAPTVAAAPGKFLMILFLGVLFLFIIIYYVVSSGDKKEAPPKNPVPQKIAQADRYEPVAPLPPTPLPPQKPLAPDMPEPPPLPTVPVITEKAPTDENYRERLRSEMLVFSSGNGRSAALEDQKRAEFDYASHDPNSAFGLKAMGASKTEKAKAGYIGDLNSMIAQGKLIHGVLETAINTELPGTLRAMVSRDIYAEAGNARLIPKGSRLIGVYNTDVFRGQTRVFIIWTRVIRPDGVDIMVGSPGVDMLGRAGMEGYVDGRYRELFSTAILTSLITIGAAKGAESLLGDDSTTSTTASDGSTSTTGSSSSQATAQSIANIGGVGKRIVDNVIDTRPTITIDHGTKMNVMVNRDLLFPSSVLQQTNFVE